MKISHIAAALGLAAATSLASAAVTFDSATGTGFVGKGDVQLAFGWNNAALQSKASGLSFSYNLSTEYEAVCTWTTGEGNKGQKTHNVTHTKRYSVGGALSFDARTQNQITGFFLTGYKDGLPEVGTEPIVGAPCPGNEGHDGVWTSVVQGTTTDGLMVTYGGMTVPLPITPVL
jgi:hypothetical protein